MFRIRGSRIESRTGLALGCTTRRGLALKKRVPYLHGSSVTDKNTTSEETPEYTRSVPQERVISRDTVGRKGELAEGVSTSRMVIIGDRDKRLFSTATFIKKSGHY